MSFERLLEVGQDRCGVLAHSDSTIRPRRNQSHVRTYKSMAYGDLPMGRKAKTLRRRRREAYPKVAAGGTAATGQRNAGPLSPGDEDPAAERGVCGYGLLVTLLTVVWSWRTDPSEFVVVLLTSVVVTLAGAG